MIIGSTSNSLLIVVVIVGGWGRVPSSTLGSGASAACWRRGLGAAPGNSGSAPTFRAKPKFRRGEGGFLAEGWGVLVLKTNQGELTALLVGCPRFFAFLAVHKSINSKKINQLSSLPPFDSAVLSIFPLSLPFCFGVYQLYR